MFASVIRRIANMPVLFDALRHFLEGGYKQQRRLIREFTDGGRLGSLDCGCGTGIFSPLFRPENYTGIDLSSVYIQAAQARSAQHRFAQMDARKLDFPDESFDRALIFGLLHHMEDSDAIQVCQELSRVLKPDGQLLVCEDIPASQPWNLIGKAVHALDLGAHIRRREGYAKVLESSFEIFHDCTIKSGFMDYAVFFGSPRRSEQSSTRSAHSSLSSECGTMIHFPAESAGVSSTAKE